MQPTEAPRYCVQPDPRDTEVIVLFLDGMTTVNFKKLNEIVHTAEFVHRCKPVVII